MNEIKALNQRYETIAWGALFLWVGVRDLLPDLPVGTGILGIGLILLGLNLVRRLSNIPMHRVSTALGGMAVFLGAVELFRAWQGIQVELPFFSILLIMIGAGFLAHSLTGLKSNAIQRNE
jgi:hypothetical protein